MTFDNKELSTVRWLGVEGLFIALLALPFICYSIYTTSFKIEVGYGLVATISSLLFVFSAYFILRKPELGKFFAGLAMTGCIIVALPYISEHPAFALLGAVIFIRVLDVLISLPTQINRDVNDIELESFQRARWSGVGLLWMSLIGYFLEIKSSLLIAIPLIVAVVISKFLLLWAISKYKNKHRLLYLMANMSFLLFELAIFIQGNLWLATLLASVVILLFSSKSSLIDTNADDFWAPLINHPSRVSIITFLILCLIGSILLSWPGSSNIEEMSYIDAAFTSVSAVCVTGLIVLDTPNDFTLLGQLFILILIQLGGIGIMTLTVVALHALGQRLSLMQEKMLTSATHTNHYNLASSLIRVVKFTLIIETIGALLLSLMFYETGMSSKTAFWQGIFTSISAFCNAGFALQSDSLISFQHNPLILHTIALLIIIGGIAPAVSLIIPKWLMGEQIPLAPRISFITTIVLLVLGTFSFLAFEWHGMLENFSLIDKLHNAWFQSVTLRTAGFNSIALENALAPTFFIMIGLMFIGGSPGGTAGGIKTTTVGILFMTFWSTITGYNRVILQNRLVKPVVVFQAITIVVSGTFILGVSMLMLVLTQHIGVKSMFFEAASAVGTVGLSIGATSQLDSVGKIIIMVTMFAGRVGPVTLFTLLSRNRSSSDNEDYLDARINLT